MRASKAWRLRLHDVYCQLLVLTCLASWEWVDGQAIDCANALKSLQTNLSALQPCVASSAGAPVVLDGFRRFGSTLDSTRPALDLAFKSFTVLLLPPGAVTEIASGNITGVRLAKPATVVVQLLLAVSVQPSATLLLTDVVLETDCSTLARYQLWIAETRSVNLSMTQVDPSGDVFVSFWKQSGTTLTNCTITCRRPPAVVVPEPPPADETAGSEPTAATTTVVTVFTDVDLYNALALAPGYGSNESAVAVVVARNLTMSSPLWSAQGVTLMRNVFVVGGYGNGSSIRDMSDIILGAQSRPGSNESTTHMQGRPFLDLQDLVSGVTLADGVALTLVDLIITNAGMVFGYAPVPFTGLGFVAPFLWFFEFKRTVVSAAKPLEQLVAINCDIVSYEYDVEHIWAWAILITSNVEPIMTQAAPFKVGVYDVKLDNEHKPSLEFTIMNAYGMLYRNTRITPYSNLTEGVPLTARGAGAALYKLLIPPATTAVPVWTHSDMQNVLASAQSPGCSPYTNTTTYIHLFSNISLDGAKWPHAGYNVSCNITISGSINREGGTWLNFNLLSRFITLGEGVTLTFRYLTLFNMPSQKRTYVLGDLAQMTLPLWPVARPPSSSLLLAQCTVVLPYEEYRMLADVAGGLYHWSALNSSIKYNSLGSHSMSVTHLAGFNMVLSNTEVTDDSGNVAYTALLGPNIYGTAGMSPPPTTTASRVGDGTTATAAPRSGGGSGLALSSVVAVAVAVPLGVIALAAVVMLAFSVHRRRSHGGGVSVESPRAEGSRGPEVPASGAGPGSAPGSKALVASGLAFAGVSSNNTPHSECDASGATEGQAAEAAGSAAKASEFGLDAAAAVAPPLHVELHQLILDFAREIEDKHLAIHEALGSGGFATVYRGTWRGIDVAVKVIEFQDRAAGKERLQARAMTEAAIAANIQHSNIVTTYSYDIRPSQPDGGADTPSSTLLGIGPGPEGGPAAGGNFRRGSGSSDHSSGSQAPRMWKLYLIQEFCEVGSLRIALENRMFHAADGTPNLPMILRLMLDVVRGLQHLHRKNIVHGDLTPGNILLKANASRPGQYVAKLADFGLSVKMNPSQTSVDNNRTGTPFYASPEVRQHGNLTKASDLYALGVVLWEMWHGRPCYQRVRGIKHYIHATGYPSFPPCCPRPYVDLAGRCLRRALEERPPLDEVHDVLRNLLGSAVSSGLSSGSEGGTSGSPSQEWPFLPNMGGLGARVLGDMGQGHGYAAAMAAFGAGAGSAAGAAGGGGGGAGGAGVSEGSGAVSDGPVVTGVGSTSSWFPAALAAGFQAASPPAAGAPGRDGSGRGNPAATAAAAAAAAALSPQPGHGVGQGGVGGAAGRQVTQQLLIYQQYIQQAAGAGTWPRGGLPHPGHGPTGNGVQEGTAPPAIAQRTLPPCQRHPQRSPLAPPSLQQQQQQQLRQSQGHAAADERAAGDAGVGVATPAPLPAPAAQQQAQGLGDVEEGQAPLRGAGGRGLPPVMVSSNAPANTRSSFSLKMGTAEDHFVTAPGSND